MSESVVPKNPIASRFRGYLPVVVDTETSGLDAKHNALLEVAAVILKMDEQGLLYPAQTLSYHLDPFPGARFDPASMAINRIQIGHPFRFAVPELQALTTFFEAIRTELRETGCSRAILVGHNAFFDLKFLNAASNRLKMKRGPFHPFSSFDTVSLAGMAFGQTVLAKAMIAAGLPWDASEAHSAIYDAEHTAQLFCHIINRWKELGGWVPPVPQESEPSEE